MKTRSVVRTKQLNLRLLKTSDFKKWQEAHLNEPAPKNSWDKKYRFQKSFTKSDFNKVLKNEKQARNNDKSYSYGIFLKDNTYIGGGSLMYIQRGAVQCAMIGCVLINRYWNSGYGKETLYALMDIGFRDLRLHRIEGYIEGPNYRSQRLVRSVGMKKEGPAKHYMYLNKKWINTTRYYITCEDLGIKWKGLNKK